MVVNLMDIINCSYIIGVPILIGINFKQLRQSEFNQISKRLNRIKETFHDDYKIDAKIDWYKEVQGISENYSHNQNISSQSKSLLTEMETSLKLDLYKRLNFMTEHVGSKKVCAYLINRK